MAVTFTGGREAHDATSKTKYPDLSLDQIEVFGRLRMTKKQIAEWYNLTVHQVSGLFRRPDVRAAYDRGRTETVVAIRQKQLQLALGGNVQMLIHAGEQFADQVRGGEQVETEDFETSRFSWEGEMKRRLQQARDDLFKSDDNSGGDE